MYGAPRIEGFYVPRRAVSWKKKKKIAILRVIAVHSKPVSSVVGRA